MTAEWEWDEAITSHDRDDVKQQQPRTNARANVQAGRGDSMKSEGAEIWLVIHFAKVDQQKFQINFFINFFYCIIQVM